MIAWTQFLPQVAMRAPDCPQLVMVEAIRRAAIEFCDESLALREWQEYMVAPNEREVEFEQSEWHDVAQIMAAELQDGRPIDVITPEDATRKYPGWRATRTGNIEALTQISPSAFVPIACPAASAVLVRLEVALRPVQGAEQAHESLYSNWRTAIEAGALAGLLDIPKKPWTNEAKAGVYAMSFESAKHDARLDAQKAFGRARLRTRTRFF